jgi:two-component system LytT family sensor kinase
MVNLKTRHRLFWILQTSGWLFYLVVVLVSYALRGNLTRPLLIETSADTGIGFLATLSLRLLYKKIRIHDHSLLTLFLLAFVFSLLGGGLAARISSLFQSSRLSWEMPGSGLTLRSYLTYVLAWTTLFFAWSAGYFGLKFWQEWMSQKEQAEKAQTLAETAQLQMLRYRINPHFLFNALNSIRALVSENKASAKAMITDLSEYLRYSLVSKNYESVPFKDEVESVRHYFAIQKMRYENKLDVSLEVEPAAEEYPVPSFFLHPLVENAVKYGMSTSSIPLKIRVKAGIDRGILRVEVANSGSWIESSRRDGEPVIGKGLDNVRRRLADAYPGRHRLEVSEKDGSVSLRLALGEGRGE